MRRFSFDIDGTLVDTRELNRLAYLELGVEIPDYAWGLPWHQWLPDLFKTRDEAVIIHRAKVSWYESFLADVTTEVPELPSAYIAREAVKAQDPGDVVILTAGSRETAETLLSRVGIEPASVALHASLDIPHRLMKLAALEPGTVYIDDLAVNVEDARMFAPHLNVIHYTDQSRADLISEIRTLNS